MLQLRLNGFTVSTFYSANALCSCWGKGIISCLSCCLCADLADGGFKWGKGHADPYDSWHFLCQVLSVLHVSFMESKA